MSQSRQRVAVAATFGHNIPSASSQAGRTDCILTIRGINMFDHIPLTLAQEDITPPSAISDGGGGVVPVTPGNGGASDNGEPGGGLGGGSGGPGGFNFLWIIILMFGVMMFMSWRSQSKEKKKRKLMLEAMHKGDKVQTAGGVLGTVIELREQEVVLKVDENNNTRMRFSRSAIQQVLRDEDEE